MDGRPNRRNKAAFSNFFRVVQTDIEQDLFLTSTA